MSQGTIQPEAVDTDDAVRIVLFGMPDAGKSSLLGALAQSAQLQEHALKGRLIDQTQGLMELQRRLYEDRPRETLEEVAPYPVRLEPFPINNTMPPPAPVDAVLFDCDGRVANDLLSRKEGVQGSKAEGPLARTVIDADTLVLVVDASADPSVLKRDFSQFGMFLRVLERNRGERAEVGGLPVYLVLSKCDLLAHKNDTTASWMDRIEERKRQVNRGFQEFLAQQAEREHMPFGKIDLHLWATAVKRPPLADVPAKPREPYGVAELFRQCFDSASTYRDHQRVAERRLKWTVGLVGTIVAAMGLLAGFLFFSQPNPEAAKLATEVTSLKNQSDAKAEKRLRAPLEPRIKKLQDIRESKYFNKLPQELKDFVTVSLDELTSYRDYTTQLKLAGAEFRALHIEEDPEKLKAEFGEVPPLREPELTKVRGDLEKLAPPDLYRVAWAETEPVKDRQLWFQEVTALEGAIKQTRRGYEDLLEDLRRFDALRKKDAGFQTVLNAAREVAEKARKLPHKGRDDKKVITGEVTYAHVFRVPSVVEAYERWNADPLKRDVESLVGKKAE